MVAEHITYGEPTPGAGGEFERVCFRELRDTLPDRYSLISNVMLERGGGAFYECDAVVDAPTACDVLEVKCIGPSVDVYEDLIKAPGNFVIDRPFSLLDSKAKVLATRRNNTPFPESVRRNRIHVGTWMVVPDGTEIHVHYDEYRKSCPVKSLSELVDHYKKLDRTAKVATHNECRLLRDTWKVIRDRTAPSHQQNARQLGRFMIKRILRECSGIYDYWACDEAPSIEDVRLREYPLDLTWSSEKIEAHLREVSREMRVLRKIRHPYVACVTGHFRTGCSWVQISDWFDGRPLDEMWAQVAGLSLVERLELFRKVLEGLAFCHSRGVCHRNLSASSIIVSTDMNDLRLMGFEFAKDFAATTTLGAERLEQREKRLLTPEELLTPNQANPRRCDVFQAGLLLYRLLENGAWPYEDSLEYYTSGGYFKAMEALGSEDGIEAARSMVRQMITLNPENRPDPLQKIEGMIEEMLAKSGA